MMRVFGKCVFFAGAAFAALSILAAAGARAQAADTLRVGHWGFPAGLANPYSGVPGVPQIYIWSAVFDTLLYVNEKGSPVPGLAVAWKNIDPTTWQFTLRPDVTFHNGERLNAEAVVKVFEWFQTDAGKASTAGKSFTYVTGARAVDAMTVELTTSAPRPIFPNQVAALYVVAPRAWAEMGIEDFAVNPVGSGAYRSTNWTGESISMEAYQGAWQPAKIGKLEFSRLPEAAARLQALISDQIDIMIQVGADDIPAIKAAGGNVDVVPSPLLLQLGFVLENPQPGVDITPLKDLRVRQALNHAVNKRAINENLMGGIMGINSQYSLPTAFGYNPAVEPYEYDPEKARRLLAEAGYGDGFKLVAEIRDFPDVFQQVALDLAKVGVELELRQVVPADWIKKFLAVGWEGQTFSLTLGVAPEIDTIRMMLFQSCRKNPAYYCNESLMPLIDAADAEFDPAKREKILHELMAKMRDDAPALFLFEQQEVNAYGKHVQGFRNVNRVFNYHAMTLTN